MLKLIEAYRAARTLNNAQKIAAFERLHPNCVNSLHARDMRIVIEAVDHVDQ
jgi:hypothetical protein